MNAKALSLSIAAWLAAGVTLASPGVESAAGERRSSQAAVIGKPFRVSASVTAYCATKPVVMMCESFGPQLAEFLAEKRDAQWAAPIERLIAKFMLSGGKPFGEIRALECRRTRCALEYAVNIADLRHDADGDQDLERLMEMTGGVIAPEVSAAPGGGSIVSVLIWRKR